MNVTEIKPLLIELHALYVEKFGKQPYTDLMLLIKTGEKPYIVTYHGEDLDDFISYSAGTVGRAFKQAFDHLNNLPSEDERNLAEFKSDLSKLIDKGNDFNIPVDFMNPIIEMSKSLAENALEFHGEVKK